MNMNMTHFKILSTSTDIDEIAKEMRSEAHEAGMTCQTSVNAYAVGYLTALLASAHTKIADLGDRHG